MIEVICRENSIGYDAYHITKAFFPKEELSLKVDAARDVRLMVVEVDADGVKEIDTRESTSKEIGASKILGSGDDGTVKAASDRENAAEIGGAVKVLAAIDAENKETLVRELYRQLSVQTGKTLPWGVLTGVRPTKLAMSMIEKMPGGTSPVNKEAFIEMFARERMVSSEKATLAWDIVAKEKSVIHAAISGRDEDPESFSIYIGIPVCPSICSYCSFPSGPLSAWKNRMDSYVDALCLHLESVAALMAEKRLTTIYIGGGTPTVLTAPQLRKLLECVSRNFDVGSLMEFNLEAGRPDTVDEEKLKIAKDLGITRLCLNPQTMHDETLKRIGRAHTTEQLLNSFNLARRMGFCNINMDVIAGLPGEGPEHMEITMDRITELSPEGVTVHSLAVKRAAKLDTIETDAADVMAMLEIAREKCGAMQLEPYYMYRQKSIAGNFENVGYAKDGLEGIYNILMMEEVQSIIGIGAGASTKILLPEKQMNPERPGKMTNLLHRDNPKDINSYIDFVQNGVYKVFQ